MKPTLLLLIKESYLEAAEIYEGSASEGKKRKWSKSQSNYKIVR